MDGPDLSRPSAFARQLVEIHAWFTDELDRLIDTLGEPGATVSPDLRAHCLAFCSALGQHHTKEDGGILPALAAADPRLEPTVAKLAQDHEMLGTLLIDLERLAASVGPDSSDDELTRVRGQVHGIAAIMESHFRFEERTVLGAIDALDALDT